MLDERRKKLEGHLGRGVLFSFLIHGSFLFPVLVLAFVIGGRQKAEQDNEIDVRFEDVSRAELPDNLPALERDAPAPPQADPRAKAAIAQADSEESPPEPEVEMPPPDQMPPMPPPPKAHQKSVDLDMGKDVEPPPDAKYLAQKNNRAEQETRATDTNLEREQQGTQGSAPSPRTDPQVGEADNKIADLEDRASKLGRQAPALTPHLDPELRKAEKQPSRKSLLALRDAPRRSHEITPETADPSLARDLDGIRALNDDASPEPGSMGKAGGPNKPRLTLTGKQYEYLFGDDADAARALAQKSRSKRAGRFAERMGRIRSALENFIPEVRPGNQTALNTRAAPFAAFIARMHRTIHKLWGFGFLEDLERKPGSNPYNNPDLVTKLELVLNGDGTVSKVTVIRPSGLLPFDVAAIDVVHSAAPFADPPREIRSGNGKIYVHWSFHRDERRCATSGADYFILDNAGAAGDKGEARGESGGIGEMAPGIPTPGPRDQGPRRLSRDVPDTPAHRAKMRELDRAAGEPEEESRGGRGNRRGQSEPDPVAARRAAQQVVRADDPAARTAAESWFDAYARGDIARIVRLSALPFGSTNGVAAANVTELTGLLRGLVDETPGNRTVRALQMYSAAGARGTLGGIPPGFDDGAGMLFAVAHIAGDTYVLVLGPRNGSWKAIGLVRH